MRTQKFPKPKKRGPKPKTRLPRGAVVKGDKLSARKKKLKRAADLWRDLVRAKEPSGICPRCRKRKWTDAAHCFTKGAYPGMRFEPDQGIPLCRTCHQRVDSDHHAKVELWRSYIGGVRYARLELMASAHTKLDLDLVLMDLEEQKAKLCAPR